MKRALFTWLLVFTFLPLMALAAPEPIYPEGEYLNLPIEVLDSPYDDGEWYGSAPLALRMTAPNGQDIYFVSSFLKPIVEEMDVNFDGIQDLVVMVDPGGTNVIYRLFIWQDGKYVPVNDGDERGLYNLRLYPKQKLVGINAVSGEAGALHEETLLKWEGNRLIRVRRAVCFHKEEVNFSDNVVTQSTWYNIFHARVYRYDQDGFVEEPIWEGYHDTVAQGMDKAYDAFYESEQRALWSGLE